MWPHISAEGNGLRNVPRESDACPFLVVEDFGTSGLTGDVAQWHEKPGIKNPFYYFFRAEGQSGKGERDRGRWGVGKTVFPRSSRISSYYGMTVREDDHRQLLMGQAVLKSHMVAGAYYSPDGYYGVRPEGDLTLPIEQREVILRFIDDFHLARRDEPGLSVVVPWCDPEITKDAVIEAVCRDYFYPILAAKLAVTVATEESEIVIDHSSLLEVSREIAHQLPQEFLAVVELADWATQRRPTDFEIILAPQKNTPPVWSSSLVSEELIKKLSTTLQAGERTAIRIPINVRRKDGQSRDSYFDVFLARDARSEAGRPVFIREGIIISDIRSARNRGVTSLVVVEDEPLATLLGDSENPAHTQWQRDSSHYKGKYFYGPAYIQFVTRSVKELLQIISADEDQSDPTLLLDFFSIPAWEEPNAPEEDAEKERKPKAKPELPPSSPRRFVVQKAVGGFSITHGPKAETIPPFLDIRVAYDIRRGNPLAKYNEADFNLAELSIDTEGVELKRRMKNNLVVAIKTPEFRIAVKGFDVKRDLYIKVLPKEEFND